MKYISSLFAVIFFVTCQSGNGFAANNATTEVRMSGNLDVGNLYPGSFYLQLPNTYTSFIDMRWASSFHVPVTVFDSKNLSHEITLFFFHLEYYKWVVLAVVDGKDVSLTEGTPIIVGSSTFTGNSAGEVDPIRFYSIVNWANAQTGNIKFTLNFTAFDNKSLVEKIEFRPSGCEVIESGVNAVLYNTAEQFLTEGSSCAASPDSFGVSSAQLAERAIASKKCDVRKFKTLSECRRCFDLAAAPLRKPYDKSLFRGLFVIANRNVERQKNILCSK
jgi:hypothetical protein